MNLRSRRKAHPSGAVTRIGGDPAQDQKLLENTWDWTAVNALVGLTKANINAVHTNRKNQSSSSRERSG